MKLFIKNIALSVLLSFWAKAYSQTGSYQNLYFIKNGEQPVFTEKDYDPHEKGFYIYRNCIYDLVLKNKLQLSAKIIDIKNDSLYYTVYINQIAAQKNKDGQDTLSLHPPQIKRIKMIGDRIIWIYSGRLFKSYEYVLEQSAEPKKFNTRFQTVYSADSSRLIEYELVAYLTAQGLDLLYEQCGTAYYYGGIFEQQCTDTSKKQLIRKKGVWFSPSNANEVRGVNIGLQTMNAQDGPLNINGVNLSADVFSFFVGVMGLFYKTCRKTKSS